jgi:hypothetical protein
MKHNPLSGSIKAALAVGAIEDALAHAFGNSEPERPGQLVTDPGERRVWHSSAVLAQEQDDAAAVREANLVLPRKQANRDLARMLQADLDRELAVALGRALGTPLTDPAAQLEGHTFECQVVAGHEEETYLLDGVPILWAGPVTYEDNGEQVSVARPLKHL